MIPEGLCSKMIELSGEADTIADSEGKRREESNRNTARRQHGRREEREMAKTLGREVHQR